MHRPTPEETDMNRSTIRSFGARTVALLAIVFTTFLVSTPAASAYQHNAVSGRPGSVRAYQTLGTHLQVPCGGYGYTNCFAPGLTVQGPVVYRSPASTSTQYVTVRYTVHRWNGVAWVYETSRDFYGPISTGQTGVALQTWKVLTTSGYKKTSFSIVWSNAYGQILATSAVAMNGNDYACSTRFTFKCTAYTGSVAVYTP
jgi:hypothetical protein